MTSSILFVDYCSDFIRCCALYEVFVSHGFNLTEKEGWQISLWGSGVYLNVGCCYCEEDSFRSQVAVHPHPPKNQPSACPWWYVGSLAVQVEDNDWDTNSRLCIGPLSACFFHLPPRSLLQFSRCPGYLSHGNCASLQAQTQIPPHVSLLASMMTQQLLQGFSFFPPRPQWYAMLIRQSSVLSFSPIADLNTKWSKIKKHPTALMCF